MQNYRTFNILGIPMDNTIQELTASILAVSVVGGDIAGHLFVTGATVTFLDVLVGTVIGYYFSRAQSATKLPDKQP